MKPNADNLKRWALAQGFSLDGIADGETRFKSVRVDGIECKGKDNDRVIVTTATSDAVDQDGEVVLPDGADTDYFFKARAILFNHDPFTPVGSLRNANLKDNKKWVISFKMASTQLAQDVYTLVQEGVIRGVSIGFMSMEGGPPTDLESRKYPGARYVHRVWRWMETSLTAMPCNQDALITAVKSRKIADSTAKILGVDGKPAQKSVVVDDGPRRVMLEVD